MVKHVILWQLKDEYNEEQKAEIKAGIKAGLESLAGKIPGLVEIKVQVDRLASSNAEVMLDSTFESEEALKAYQAHPLHREIAVNLVRPSVESRLSFDYNI